MSAPAPPPPPEGWTVSSPVEPVAGPPEDAPGATAATAPSDQSAPSDQPPAPPAHGGGITRLWRSDGGRRLVVVLTLILTILAAVVAGLEVAASQRADDANRDSQALAILGTGAVIAAGEAARFETGLLADVLRTTQDSLVFGATALELAQKGDDAAAAEARTQSEVSAARAARLRELSLLYADERYAPPSEDEFPDVQRFLDDQNAPANDLVAQQNAAADEYGLWDGKSSSYVAILTVIALAFFLLGVAQVSQRMRPFLGLSATGLITVCLLWTVVVTAT